MSDINTPEWLPKLIRLEDFSGDWQRYEDEVYAKFYTDFVESKPFFFGRPVNITKQIVKGKERTFWHLIQEGKIEEHRTPDLRRCERIRWIRAIIEHQDDSRLKKWAKKIGRHMRSLLWFNYEFLVVLEKRKSDWILWTAYCTDWEHTKTRLIKECEDSQK